MRLPTITACALPAQAYAHAADHDVRLTADPAHWRPIEGVGTGFARPKPGTGLWTSPVTARTPDGAPADSAWLERLRLAGRDTSVLHLTEIIPAAEARLLLIDDPDHLAAIIATYPEKDAWSGRGRLYPRWASMADDWDAVYLTSRGQATTHSAGSGLGLPSWDVETVLWLRPAYTVGRTAQACAASQAGAV